MNVGRMLRVTDHDVRRMAMMLRRDLQKGDVPAYFNYRECLKLIRHMVKEAQAGRFYDTMLYSLVERLDDK